MIREHRTNLYSPEIEFHFLKFFKGDAARHLIETNGKKCALHLLEKRAAQSVHRTFVTENANVDARVVGRDEKGKALNVVPMRVRHEHGDVDRHVAKFFHKRLTESAN